MPSSASSCSSSTCLTPARSTKVKLPLALSSLESMSVSCFDTLGLHHHTPAVLLVISFTATVIGRRGATPRT